MCVCVIILAPIVYVLNEEKRCSHIGGLAAQIRS